LLAAIADEPTTMEEALKSKPWRTTMMELESIGENETWSLVDLTNGHKEIGLKWVFKHDEQGRLVKHQARLVTKRYVQRQSVDFEEVFAPIARMESVRVMLAVEAHYRWTVHHMDVKFAFLNGDLPEEVYAQQLSGFTIDGQERKLLWLNEALYGLRQAPRAWNSKLDVIQHELDFLRCKSEHGLYARVMKKLRLVVGVYVDDLIIMGESEKEVEVFKEEMKREFRMSDLGALPFYLGIEVKQLQSGIELCHNSYAIKLLKDEGL
jgi:hypothetical protein